jgi:large-conductance mechanosensitive channel
MSALPSIITPSTAHSIFEQFSAFIKKQRLIDFFLILVLSTCLVLFVTTFLKNIVVPPLALALSKLNIPDSWNWTLKQKTDKEKAIVIRFGDFIEIAIVTSLLAYLTYFLLVQREKDATKQGRELIEPIIHP